MQSDQHSGFSPQTVLPDSSAGLSVDGTATSSLNSLFMPRLLRSSSIDGVLNKGDIKLEELLDEEDFVYDLKNGNPKLLDYFSKNPGNIRNLIDYVTIMPPDPEDTKRAHKYPFTACEVFEADVAPIMNAFFFTHAQKASETSNSPTRQDEKASLLEYLFAFVETDKEINPVLGGYFNKVVQVLFKRNPRRMTEFVYEKENYLLNMVKHLQEKSIAELIILFICYENSQTDENPQSRLGIKRKVLDHIFEILVKPADENYGEEASINAGNILNEIIQKHNNIIDGNELIRHIASGTTTQKLFDSLKNADTAKITSVGNVLCGILKYYAPDAMDFGPADTFGYGSQNEQEKVTQVISENMSIFLTILQNEGQGNKVETVFGSTVKSIGSGRLKVIEILEKIVKLDNMDIYEKLSDLNLLKIVTDLFNESPWNNILHSIYEQLINTVLDKADTTLFKSLFERANFLDVIIQAGQNPLHELPKRGRKVRKGYMGHVIRLANELVRYGNIDDTVEKYLKGNRNWDNFVYNILKKQNEINNTQIGGYNPRSFGGAPSGESSFGSLAESQPMMMPASSEGGFAMPSYEEEMEGERSPNKAGDISGTSKPQPTFDWNESSIGNSVDALVDSIFRKTKTELELSRNHELNRLGVEGIHEVKRNEENEMARVRFANKEGRRSFGSDVDLGPKDESGNKSSGSSPEKGLRTSLTKTPEKSPEKGVDNNNLSPPKSEEAKDDILSRLRVKNPAMEHMTQSAIARRKVKLKLKKGEKANPLKILEAIDKYKSSKNNTSVSAEYTFTETSYSDSRHTDSEGLAILEEEQKEEMLARLREEESLRSPPKESNGLNGVKAEISPEKVERSPEKAENSPEKRD